MVPYILFRWRTAQCCSMTENTNTFKRRGFQKNWKTFFKQVKNLQMSSSTWWNNSCSFKWIRDDVEAMNIRDMHLFITSFSPIRTSMIWPMVTKKSTYIIYYFKKNLATILVWKKLTFKLLFKVWISYCKFVVTLLTFFEAHFFY